MASGDATLDQSRSFDGNNSGENGVFEIAHGADGGGVESLDCPDLPVDEEVQDITEQCAESCWPLVLGKSGRLYNCGPKPEALAPFQELPGISGVKLGAGDFYVQKTDSVLHFPSRKSLARPLPGLVGFDVFPRTGGDDIFLFSANHAEAFQVRRAETGQRQKWALPPTLPSLRAACAIDSSTVLAAVQDPSLEDHPRFFRFHLRA